MQRAIGLRGAVAINVITMIGIGPLVTIPLVLAALGGPLALIGWIAGALVALCDGLVWAELASRYPGSGGTYVYLREIFGNTKLGQALAFLFNWQFLLYAPCLLASGYIGFANYAAYLWPAIAANPWLHDGVAVAIGIVTIALLYRRVSRVATTGIVLAIASLLTLGLVAIAALSHAHLATAFHLDAPLRFNTGLLAGFGSALFVTLYDYVGYADAALLGDEVRTPRRTIPLAILLSILVVAVFYVALQIGILGVIPWRTLFDAHGAPTVQSSFIGSLVVERTWGIWAARLVTLLVLVTAFASLYGNLLGFSRIPYAAARDGNFLAPFARLHPRTEMPAFSLVAIGLLSLVAAFFTLDQVIAFLTAGIVLIQSVAQIVALAVMRKRDAPAPFRMPLYPLPAIVALLGWAIAFIATGWLAIALGIGWLAIGLIAFIFTSRARRAALMLVALIGVFSSARVEAADSWATWTSSAVVNTRGTPVFTVDNAPFFVYGAAFFYERIPQSAWRTQLLAYRALGINTIDLYVMWNWHEPDEKTIDFDGHTNPQRNLRALLTTIDQLGMKVILRPGPVIRNEWRNGGYPDWLLRRPEYGMPLHDILEGRYPATATLQNAHADAAAAEWLANPTHLDAASRWLHTVLSTVEPWSRDVIAIALDDDQGAYIDNDTWPAPHWHAYITWLRDTVRSVVGLRVPLFINTYQMKVTALAPVWAWGNWYQSDAYRIGDHDLSQLAFSTELLRTQPNLPVMASEFQAGWLQGADEIAPRPAAPENTTLALHTLLQHGAHGVVNFPVQDTLNPAGWEAPWANWFYAWDAALDVRGNRTARAAPSAAFGNLVATLGPFLATLTPKSDAAIAWLPSAYDSAAMTNDRIVHLAELTIAQQQRCRVRARTCRLVDLRFEPDDALARTHVLVIPRTGFAFDFTADVERRLARFLATGGIVLDDVAAAPTTSATAGLTDATLLLDPSNSSGVLDIINAGTMPRTTPSIHLQLGYRVSVPSMVLGPGEARDVLLNFPLHTSANANDRLTTTCMLDGIGNRMIYLHPSPHDACFARLAFRGDVFPFHLAASVFGSTLALDPRPHLIADSVTNVTATTTPSDRPALDDVPITNATSALLPAPWVVRRAEPAIAYVADVYHDGENSFVLENARLRVVVRPDAGARVFLFEDLDTHRNAFTTIGAARDALASPPPASSRDYIAAYTHPIDAGTFNRRYACAIVESGARAVVRCTYDAPDFGANPVHFQKIFTLDAATPSLAIDLLASADAASISAVTADASLLVTPPSDAHLEERITNGYRLLTLRYRAGHAARLVFSLKPTQGAGGGSANRP